jgi:hypothetical protein
MKVYLEGRVEWEQSCVLRKLKEESICRTTEVERQSLLSKGHRDTTHLEHAVGQRVLGSRWLKSSLESNWEFLYKT